MATPIGNLADITLRAVRVLSAADAIACEDTRTTSRLLARHGIRTHLVSYHEHNAARMRPQILKRIAAGDAIALVSDAGAPLISDPGYRLVAEAAAEGLSVVPVPGPSALTAALMAAGLATDRVLFAGFLPAKPQARGRAIAELGAVPATLVLFESARRLPATLEALAESLGPRPACVARELTKLYEELRRGTLTELAAHYATEGPPKGEVTLVIGRADGTSGDAPENAFSDDAVDDLLRDALSRLSASEAARNVARQTGRPRRALYARATALKESSR